MVVDVALARHRHARRIVEVGIGRRPATARALRHALPATQVVAVDNDESVVAQHGREPYPVLWDDVLMPRWAIYRGASLIYAVHPPPELLPALARLAEGVAAELVCVHLHGESGCYQGPGWAPVVVEGRVAAWRRGGQAGPDPPGPRAVTGHATA
ncbi:MAG TPA: UPF0146 family protein [Candidatus Thermoplasmatota archaeon]|nr:UPF0146 family protein [Candidatus Thermoplasmatota archaeon]